MATPALAAPLPAPWTSAYAPVIKTGLSPFGPDPDAIRLVATDDFSARVMECLTDVLPRNVALRLFARAIAVEQWLTNAQQQPRLTSEVVAAMNSPHRWVEITPKDLLTKSYLLCGGTSELALDNGVLAAPAKVFRRLLRDLPPQLGEGSVPVLKLVMQSILAMRIVIPAGERGWTAKSDEQLAEWGGPILRLNTSNIPTWTLNPPLVQACYTSYPLANALLDLHPGYGLDPSACAEGMGSAFDWVASRGNVNLCIRLATVSNDAALNAASANRWPLLCRLVNQLYHGGSVSLMAKYNSTLEFCCSAEAVHDDGSGLQLFATADGHTAQEYAYIYDLLLREGQDATVKDNCRRAIVILDAAVLRLKQYAARSAVVLHAVLGGTRGELTDCICTIPLPDPLVTLIHGYCVASIPPHT